MKSLTRKELSNVSVYQHILVEWKAVLAKSGRNIDVNCLIASTARSGIVALSAAGNGTDHLPSCVYGALSGAG